MDPQRPVTPPPPADLALLGAQNPALFPQAPFQLSQPQPPPLPPVPGQPAPPPHPLAPPFVQMPNRGTATQRQLSDRREQAATTEQNTVAGIGDSGVQRKDDLFAPLHHDGLPPPNPSEHPFDQVATDIASYIEHMSDQLAAMMREGGRSPFAAALSRQQQEQYYVDEYGPLVYHPDGSPNERGRDALEAAFGPDGFAEIVRVVLRHRRGEEAALGAPLMSYPLFADQGTPLPGYVPVPRPPLPPARPQALQPPLQTPLAGVA